jgi:hypothetical protein
MNKDNKNTEVNDTDKKLHISDVRNGKLKKGDNVNIINVEQVGYGQENLIIIGITKHRHKNITLYEVQNDSSRFYCKKEDLEKI